MVTKDKAGNIKAQLIDFGYACYGLQADAVVSLPFSPPWTAPEHEWKDFHIVSAIKMDVYSLGMTCAYVLFYETWPTSLQPERQLDPNVLCDHAFTDFYRPVGERLSAFDELTKATQNAKISTVTLPPNVVEFLKVSLTSNEQHRISDLIPLAELFLPVKTS